MDAPGTMFSMGGVDVAGDFSSVPQGSASALEDKVAEVNEEDTRQRRGEEEDASGDEGFHGSCVSQK